MVHFGTDTVGLEDALPVVELIELNREPVGRMLELRGNTNLRPETEGLLESKSSIEANRAREIPDPQAGIERSDPTPKWRQGTCISVLQN